MKLLLAVTTFLFISLALAAPAFICKSSDGDDLSLERVDGAIRANVNNVVISPTIFEPGVSVSVVGPNLKLHFDRISGLGTMRYENRFSQVDCSPEIIY